MGFNKDRAIIAQNSATAAATIVAALVAAGDPSAVDAFEDIRTSIYEGTLDLAGGTPSDEAPRGNGGGRRSFGGRRNGGGNADDAGAGVVVKFGKFAGKTISEVYDEDPEYVEWLAESSTNAFIKSKATEYLASVV